MDSDLDTQFSHPMADQEFCFGGAVYGHVKKLNNKIGPFKILYKEFFESRRCDHTHVLTLGSAAAPTLDRQV